MNKQREWDVTLFISPRVNTVNGTNRFQEMPNKYYLFDNDLTTCVHIFFQPKKKYN